ncbi:DoxX family protein [Candidatus Wolfebacteria bacterium]|nr:DoxX family protein [Candidatus Wolfebacteria bacterium]
MLSVFPQLLTFSLIAPFILRVAVGFAFIALGASHFGKGVPDVREELMRVFPWAGSLVVFLGVAELILGILLVVGLWTQVAALLAGIGSLKLAFLKHRFAFRAVAPFSIGVYILLAIMSLSLLLTGAGFFAFDLPL